MGLTRQQLTMVAVLLAGALIAVLNQTLLTPALPTIMDNLDVNATTVQWLTSAYSLVEAVVIPLNAYLLGRFPSRRLFIFGMGLFTAGCLLCAVAPSFPFLLLGRICQATATGIAMPTVFTLILLIFPRESRGSAMGIIGLIIGFAPAIGPSVSGVLVDTIGWRALFVVVCALAACIVVAAAVALKNFEGFERTTLDVPSVVLIAVGMVCLLYGLSTFSSAANLALPVALMAVGAALLALFARRQLKLAVPILRVDILRGRRFRTTVVVILFLYATLIGSGVVLPMYVQDALGASATVSGLIMLPGAVVGAVCGLLAGRLFDRHGVRAVAVVGACVLLVGGLGYFLLSEDSTVLMVGAVYTVACVGIQALTTPVNTWGINSLPNANVSHGNAILSTLEQVGGSLGTAFVVSLTAFGPAIAGEGASAAQVEFASCHAAFGGLIGIVAVVAGTVLLFVRDSKKDAQPAKAGKGAFSAKAAPAGVKSGEPAAPGIPGVDRPFLVADVMNAQADALSETDTVRAAVAIMERTETSGVPIVRADGTLAGFLSDGDVLKRLSRHDSSRTEGDAYLVLMDPESLQDRLGALLDRPALDFATKRVVSVDADSEAEEAFRTLSERRIKKVPVVRDGKFAGTLSRRNLMKALAALART